MGSDHLGAQRSLGPAHWQADTSTRPWLLESGCHAAGREVYSSEPGRLLPGRRQGVCNHSKDYDHHLACKLYWGSDAAALSRAMRKMVKSKSFPLTSGLPHTPAPREARVPHRSVPGGKDVRDLCRKRAANLHASSCSPQPLRNRPAVLELCKITHLSLIRAFALVLLACP